MIHGKVGTYTNKGCRCQECRDAKARYEKDLRARRIEETAFYDVPHGTTNGYCNYGCRCEDCLEAIRTYQQGRAA